MTRAGSRVRDGGVRDECGTVDEVRVYQSRFSSDRDMLNHDLCHIDFTDVSNIFTG